MLSNTWGKQREDLGRRKRLFQGMARLILSLARVPQPRIGSFQFNSNCTITLTNRPLTCSMAILENDGTPRIIQRSETYTSTEPFVSDMLTFHDNRFLSNLNAVYDDDDCRGHMAVKTLLRALSHHYIKREHRNGPFILQLTDFHASNIFVDEEWNVTCLIDLEWMCALPVEMLAVPYWLAGCGIDQIEGGRFDEFSKVRREFMRILEEEESKATEHNILLSKVMHEMWESKGVWFWYCLESVNAMVSLLSDHICPKFLGYSLSPKVEAIVFKFWCEDAEGIVEKKVADHKRYDEELRGLFHCGPSEATGGVIEESGC